MTDEELKHLRHVLESQFRNNMYTDIKFPFLQSLGIKDIIQGVGNDELGFIGILHLKWANKDNNIVYDNSKEWPVKVKGTWESTWYDTVDEGHHIAQKLKDDRIIDNEKVMSIMHAEVMKRLRKKRIPISKSLQPVLN